MPIFFGTRDGVWRLDGGRPERVALAGQAVSHVADRDGVVLAAMPRDGLYDVSDGSERRLWEGDARACAIAPDGARYVGIEPAMIYRSEDGGASWTRLDGVDELPTRGEWYFPPPPHEPHVRSIDFLARPSSVLAGVEVGGVLRSDDRGDTWRELNDGVHADVHTVRPDPGEPDRFIAVTGGGLYLSEDAGASWERIREGLGQGYAVGLHFNPERAGEALVATGERPPGLEARVYHTLDGGRSWSHVARPPLPERYDRVPVVLFAEGAAWIATDDGQVFRADHPRGPWTLVCELPASIDCASAGGSPSSVESGYR